MKPAIKRAGKVIAEALSESESCPLHLENTAGAGGTLGRSFEELAALLEASGGDGRLGVCLDSCHLLASGFEIRTAEALSSVIDDCVALVGTGRIGSLHLNDSQAPLGSNRDRHADVGRGRARRGRVRCVPLRAALRRPAVRHGDARAGQARADAGAGAAGQGPAPARAGEAAAGGGAGGDAPPSSERAPVRGDHAGATWLDEASGNRAVGTEGVHPRPRSRVRPPAPGPAVERGAARPNLARLPAFVRDGMRILPRHARPPKASPSVSDTTPRGTPTPRGSSARRRGRRAQPERAPSGRRRGARTSAAALSRPAPPPARGCARARRAGSASARPGSPPPAAASAVRPRCGCRARRRSRRCGCRRRA